MLKHIILFHEDKEEQEVEFNMRVMKFHRSAFERQIHESVLIQSYRRENNIMNSRTEYNRCSVPRLGVKMNERAVKEVGEEEAIKLEQELEERIKTMKRTRKIPGGANDGPAKKRLRLSQEQMLSDKLTNRESDGQTDQQKVCCIVRGTPPAKRKIRDFEGIQCGDSERRKKKNKNGDINDYRKEDIRKYLLTKKMTVTEDDKSLDKDHDQKENHVETMSEDLTFATCRVAYCSQTVMEDDNDEAPNAEISNQNQNQNETSNYEEKYPLRISSRKVGRKKKFCVHNYREKMLESEKENLSVSSTGMVAKKSFEELRNFRFKNQNLEPQNEEKMTKTKLKMYRIFEPKSSKKCDPIEPKSDRKKVRRLKDEPQKTKRFKIQQPSDKKVSKLIKMFENLPGGGQKGTDVKPEGENLKNLKTTFTAIQNEKSDKISVLKPISKFQPYKKKMSKSDGKFDLKSYFTKDPSKKLNFSQQMSKDHHPDQGTRQNIDIENSKLMTHCRSTPVNTSKPPGTVEDQVTALRISRKRLS